jgi:hypothetical protein
MSIIGRRHLVLVRAGEKSLHRQWLEGAEARSWDLIVSWYGDEPYQPVADELVLNRKGGKWDIIHAHFTEMPELLDRYDYFWLTDDDIATDGATIEAMFGLMEQERLEVGQPGLTPDSYFSFLHTLASPSFRLRYTTFVEVMTPCLGREVVRRMLPHFPASKSGFGLDLVWARLEADNRERAAILDAVPMRHTRPVGQFLSRRLKAQGVYPKVEGREIARRFGLGRQNRFPCYGGITASGQPVGFGPTVRLMLWDYLRGWPRWVEPSARRRLWRMLGRLGRRPDLSQLHEVAAAEPPETAPGQSG